MVHCPLNRCATARACARSSPGPASATCLTPRQSHGAMAASKFPATTDRRGPMARSPRALTPLTGGAYEAPGGITPQSPVHFVPALGLSSPLGPFLLSSLHGRSRCMPSGRLRRGPRISCPARRDPSAPVAAAACAATVLYPAVIGQSRARAQASVHREDGSRLKQGPKLGDPQEQHERLALRKCKEAEAQAWRDRHVPRRPETGNACAAAMSTRSPRGPRFQYAEATGTRLTVAVVQADGQDARDCRMVS